MSAALEPRGALTLCKRMRESFARFQESKKSQRKNLTLHGCKDRRSVAHIGRIPVRKGRADLSALLRSQKREL